MTSSDSKVHGAIPGAGSACRKLQQSRQLPLFQSEVGSTYGDTVGAMKFASFANGEFLASASQGDNFWNPFGGYYPGISFYGHSLMDCHHPWSGHYRVRSPIWAAAHACQHTRVGMDFLQPVGGTGVLQGGCGTMLAFVTNDGKDVTLKIESALAMLSPPPGGCPAEEATFQLKGKLAGVGGVKTMAVWLTEFDDDAHVVREFERQPDVAVDAATGQFTTLLPANSIITITSLTSLGHKGAHPTPPAAAPFPMPYAEDFNGYPKENSNMARYFSDMSGGFEVVPDPTAGGGGGGTPGAGRKSRGGVLKQMTPIMPVGWYAQTQDICPYTVVGSADWTNYTAAVDIHLPSTSAALGWIGARIGGNSECDGPAPICSTPWGLYAVLDNSPGGAARGAGAAGRWELRLHLRLTEIDTPSAALFTATIVPNAADGGWATVELTVQGATATVVVNGKTVAAGVDVAGPPDAPGASKSYLPPAGWVGLGGGRDYSTDLYFDNFAVSPVQTTLGVATAASSPPSVSKCAAVVQAGMPLVGVPCGVDVPGIAWDLNPVPGSPPNANASGTKTVTISPRAAPHLCTTRVSTALELAPCNATNPLQRFNYSRPLGTVSSGVSPGGGGGGRPVSPWQTFTPGQGIKYGAGFGYGATITVVRHLPQHQEAETLEFLLNGKSQSNLTMPLDLPADVVGCIGMCSLGAAGGASITAVAPATFIAGASAHGPDVTVHPAGTTATWSERGCNQIAVLDPKSADVADPSYTITINASGVGARGGGGGGGGDGGGGGGALFVDVGWCSPRLDPTGKDWLDGPPGPAEANWMGEQGVGMDWVYRSGGGFKASTNGTGGTAPIEHNFCLPPDDDFNRGEVRPVPAKAGPSPSRVPRTCFEDAVGVVAPVINQWRGVGQPTNAPPSLLSIQSPAAHCCC